jgi:hypothetical protein
MLDTKSLDEIRVEDLRELIDQGVPEGKLWEYKSQLWRVDAKENPDFLRKQRIEFLKDLSSFANTLGGHIVVGMNEEDGRPTEVCGIPIADSHDDWKNRLEQLSQHWISPRINAAMHMVEVADGNAVLLIRVSASRVGPHRVTYENHGHFYARDSKGAFAMDHDQVRAAFLQAAAISEQIRQFREQRLQFVQDGTLPFPTPSGPRLVLHLIPEAAFAARTDYSLDQINQAFQQVFPISSRGKNSVVNLDGLVLHNGIDDGEQRQATSCIQAFRNGVVECVVTRISWPHREKKIQLWSRGVEADVLAELPKLFDAMRTLGVTPPVWLFLSLLDVGNVRFPCDYEQTRGFDRDRILLPEQRIDDLNANAWSVLKPAADLIWNAAGFDRCWRIDAKGKRLDLNIDRYWP